MGLSMPWVEVWGGWRRDRRASDGGYNMGKTNWDNTINAVYKDKFYEYSRASNMIATILVAFLI